MWRITVGQQLKRAEVHADYGGSGQGGIAPSRGTPNVLLFTDPSRGHKVGYFDGWGQDGFYHYTGQGQSGDQKMTSGNRAIRDHVQDGRSLRLFESVARSTVRYVGEFVIDTDDPWYTADAPDIDDDIRSVIMFRLSPVTGTRSLGAALPFTPPRAEATVEDVEIERQHTERMVISPNVEEREAERREAPLVSQYSDYLASQGHVVSRKKIRPVGELKPLFTDLYDATDNLLIEAKGTVTREAVRMAIGQLYDYRRHIGSEPSLAVLLPSRPRQDLIELCRSAHARVIWRDGETFRMSG